MPVVARIVQFQKMALVNLRSRQMHVKKVVEIQRGNVTLFFLFLLETAPYIHILIMASRPPRLMIWLHAAYECH